MKIFLKIYLKKLRNPEIKEIVIDERNFMMKTNLKNFRIFRFPAKYCEAKRIRIASLRRKTLDLRFAFASLFESEKNSLSLRFRNRFLVKICIPGWIRLFRKAVLSSLRLRLSQIARVPLE